MKGKIAAVAGLFALGIVLYVDSAPATSRPALFEVPAGAGAGAIARGLKDGGHIRSSLWFRLLSRFTRADGKLRAGFYRVEGGARASRILRGLQSSRNVAVRVTIPEGWASWQIAERLGAAGVTPAEEFLPLARAHEGFLFPETYYFEPNTPPQKVLEVLTGRFWVVFAEVYGDTPRDPDHALRPRWRVRDAVTMASLIEREAQEPGEQALVSAVYHNRLKKRMRLECDPTVQYALGYWKNPLLRRDLQVAHPYNTYRHFGLPPGPIASPGRGALEAARSPADVKFLYFVADTSGGHQFSLTYEDHQKAVRDRKRLLKSRQKPLK